MPMRSTRLPTTLLLLALVAGGVGVALAQSDNATTSGSPAAPEKPCAASGAPSAAQAKWRAECVTNMTRFRFTALERFEENKTLAILQHDANLSHVRATFEDGKLAPLRQAARASHQAERQALPDALKAAKEGAKAEFAALEHDWLASNPRP